MKTLMDIFLWMGSDTSSAPLWSHDYDILVAVLFYFNTLIIGIMATLMPKGKKLLCLLTWELECVFILLIGLRFGMENLSLVLLTLNPLLLLSIILPRAWHLAHPRLS